MPKWKSAIEKRLKDDESWDCNNASPSDRSCIETPVCRLGFCRFPFELETKLDVSEDIGITDLLIISAELSGFVVEVLSGDEMGTGLNPPRSKVRLIKSLRGNLEPGIYDMVWTGAYEWRSSPPGDIVEEYQRNEIVRGPKPGSRLIVAAEYNKEIINAIYGYVYTEKNVNIFNSHRVETTEKWKKEQKNLNLFGILFLFPVLQWLLFFFFYFTRSKIQSFWAKLPFFGIGLASAACWGLYEANMPAGMNIRIDLFLILPLVGAAIAQAVVMPILLSKRQGQN